MQGTISIAPLTARLRHIVEHNLAAEHAGIAFAVAIAALAILFALGIAGS